MEEDLDRLFQSPRHQLIVSLDTLKQKLANSCSPCEMGDEEKVKMASLCIENAHGQSVWNVHLQPVRSLLNQLKVSRLLLN